LWHSGEKSSAYFDSDRPIGFFSELNPSFSLIRSVTLAEEIDWSRFRLFGKTPELQKKTAD
jgi:hypothetical protein